LLSPPYWLAAALSNQSKLNENLTTPTAAASFNLLHAQIRDLVSRRKSLVTEESEDDLRRESENRKEAGP
uniref:Uncharacterized protein n=1 Tax=Romanomermis culicivorax TaxID=13658 RepID=A0A915HFY4_ROMCU